MNADLNWKGSPAAVDLTLLVGTAAFEAENGRFLEVTQGADAMKLFSLVNFSTIAKRLNFDFSDVVGEGGQCAVPAVARIAVELRDWICGGFCHRGGFDRVGDPRVE